jgi:hypothetical protein
MRLDEMTLSAYKRILHKHGDRHGPNAARDGRDVRSDLRGRLVVYVAHKALSRLLAGVYGDISKNNRIRGNGTPTDPE